MKNRFLIRIMSSALFLCSIISIGQLNAMGYSDNDRNNAFSWDSMRGTDHTQEQEQEQEQQQQRWYKPNRPLGSMPRKHAQLQINSQQAAYSQAEAETEELRAAYSQAEAKIEELRAAYSQAEEERTNLFEIYSQTKEELQREIEENRRLRVKNLSLYTENQRLLSLIAKITIKIRICENTISRMRSELRNQHREPVHQNPSVSTETLRKEIRRITSLEIDRNKKREYIAHSIINFVNFFGIEISSNFNESIRESIREINDSRFDIANLSNISKKYFGTIVTKQHQKIFHADMLSQKIHDIYPDNTTAMEIAVSLSKLLNTILNYR